MSKTLKSSRLEPVAPTRVAAYIRVSTEEQARSGLGLGDQRHRISAMAVVKDWPEPVVYADEGVSGTKGLEVNRRTGKPFRCSLAELFADIEGDKIDAVIVLALDRLGRKTRLVLDLVDRMRQHDVVLVSCKESLDTTTAQGQFVLTMFAALAELEHGLISERTTGAIAELARSGRDKGGSAPYGYLRADGEITIDAAAAQIVREIFMLRGWGWTLRQIAANLNEKRVETPRGGGTWHHSSVREILLNEPAYLGGGSRGQEQLTWPQILPTKAA